MAKVDWDTEEYGESQPGNYELLPKGVYNVMITDSSVAETAKKTGKYFEFKMQVVDGAFKGRYLWARLNVHNESAEAQKIGREQYNNLCIKAGVPGAKNTTMLHNKKVAAIVVIEKRKGTDRAGKPLEPVNQVKGFLEYQRKADQQAGGESEAEAAPARAAPAKASTKGEDFDDDIPF